MVRLFIPVLLVGIVGGCAKHGGPTPEVPPPHEFENAPSGRPQSPQTDEQVFAAALASLVSRMLPSDSSNRPMLVVADETLEMCPGPYASPCLPPSFGVTYFKQRPEWGRNLESAFFAQARVQPVPRSLATNRIDVISIPVDATVRNRPPLWNLMRALAPYPQRSVAVQLSSPFYPSHSTAVIYFVSNDGGGVLFFRREDRDWRIVARDGWIY
jgi:hypothetical protein